MQAKALVEVCGGLELARKILEDKPKGTQFVHIEEDHPVVYWAKSNTSDNIGDTAYLWSSGGWEPSDDGAVTNIRLEHTPYYSIDFLQAAVYATLEEMGFEPFKAIIRVVKSIAIDPSYTHRIEGFGEINIAREPLIYAKNKDEVRRIVAEKYPQFFPDAKVFSKETKDQAQFFYVLIYPLYEYEKQSLISGEWKCSGCGQVYENEYLAYPRIYNQLGRSYKFCPSSKDEECLRMFKSGHFNGDDVLDNHNYIQPTSPTHIYKITQKSTGKCYVGKTQNQPIFRWWSHLKHSTSPFGQYLQTTDLKDWTFEVIETLPWDTPSEEVFKRETKYMIELNSIENGFNSVVSSKTAANQNMDISG